MKRTPVVLVGVVGLMMALATWPRAQAPAAAPAAQTPATPPAARQAGAPQASLAPAKPTPMPGPKNESGYTNLFNGKDLTGWKIGGPPASFKVENGAIVANGVSGAGHLFYDGAFHNHTFREFDLKLDVMAKNRSNGGIYIMTVFQETGFPTTGFEIQLNNSHTDRVRTASLYHVVDLSNIPAADEEWFPMEIMVKGMTISTFVKGNKVVEWTQPADWTTNYDTASRKIAPGTIAFQAHDPNSFTYYTNVRIKVTN